MNRAAMQEPGNNGVAARREKECHTHNWGKERCEETDSKRSGHKGTNHHGTIDRLPWR